MEWTMFIPEKALFHARVEGYDAFVSSPFGILAIDTEADAVAVGLSSTARSRNDPMDSVYLETSIVSHAAAWPSSVAEVAVLQDQAKRWFVEQRHLYDVVTSQLVIDEAGMGDRDAAGRRLALLDGILVLPVNPDAETVADEIVRRSMMPASARIDALHVASAALAGVQYLLTLNCKHIANAHELPRLYRLLESLGLGGLLICTPIEFLGGGDDEP
ncbi:MAG: type II toxin-antitoxin system VapC family toxin [Planctomycetota bacterium]|nr:type II toxin-antitoxin system VapC family toxin [Planctomycetota bacterium]